jgi:hypothetical protein
MLTRLNSDLIKENVCRKIGQASFPSPFESRLEYSSPARGTWNIVHTGMLLPEAHQIFVCAQGCLRGVVLTAAEMKAEDRFSTIAICENNVLEGDMEKLIIDGVSNIISELPVKPPAVLLYTSCIHHFLGCDLPYVYEKLRTIYPDIDFTDCYMNPIMRKSGLNPDQIMRRQLYSLIKPRDLNPKACAIIGNDLPTDNDSELLQYISESGFTCHEITSCRTYSEYQEIGESSVYFTYYPSAVPAGEATAKRLGGKHVYLPFSFDYLEIQNSLDLLSDTLGIPRKDPKAKQQLCDKALNSAREIIGSTPIAIDYTAFSRPLSLAILLLKHGFNVVRVYADSFSSEEKGDFEYLASNYPELEIYATISPGMRFSDRSDKCAFLAIGQKAAYFTGTSHFVNIVEGGGTFGYEAVIKLAGLMDEAYRIPKDAKSLIQIKGMGCGCV